MLLVIVSFLISLSSVLANASSSCHSVHQYELPLEIRNTFKEAFRESSQIYLRGQCGLNIKKLILYFQSKGISMDNATVLFILREKVQVAGGPYVWSALSPAINRNFERLWEFHVVLKIHPQEAERAQILDLDFRATPFAIRDYFDRMFPSEKGQDRLSNLLMREIDVPTYLQAFVEYQKRHDPKKTYDENEIVGAFRAKDLPQFPVQTVREFLEKE